MSAKALGKLAEKLPGIAAGGTRLLKDRLVAGFYGVPLRDLVERVFPDRKSAAAWLSAPCRGLGGRIPSRLAKTKLGRIEVKSFLIGIGNGNFQ